MLKIGSKLFVKDNSGITSVKCIGVLNKKETNITLGDIIIGSVIKSYSLEYPKSTIVKLLLIKTKKPFLRPDGTTLRFNTNSGILLTNELVPRGTKIFGAIPYEIKEKCKKLSGKINLII